MGRQPRLPAELYRDIVQHFSSKENIAPLLLTSQAFRKEAARIIFKEVNISDSVPERKMRRYDLLQSICGTVGIYVESLTVSCGAEPNDALRMILESVPNLQELAIRVEWSSSGPLTVLAQFIPSRPAFRLRSLSTDLYPSAAFLAFLESQRMSLVLLQYRARNIPNDFNLPFDFPMLAGLLTFSYPFLSSMLERASVSCISCPLLPPSQGPLHTVRAIHDASVADDAHRFSTLFPNLRYISGTVTLGNFNKFKQLIRCPPTLEKLRLRIICKERHVVTVDDLFRKIPSLLVVVVFFMTSSPSLFDDGHTSQIFKRGFDVTEGGRTRNDDGAEEWLQYRDDNYRTRTSR